MRSHNKHRDISEDNVQRIVVALMTGHQAELRVVELLENFYAPAMRRFLPKLVSSENPEVRARSVDLATMNEPRFARKLLLRCLDDSDYLVRSAAVEGLGNLGSRVVRKRLFSALQDKSYLVRAAAALAIGKTGARDARNVIEQRLKAENNPRVRVGLYAALYVLGSRVALEAFLSFLTHKNYRIRCAAANLTEDLLLSGPDKGLVIRRLIEAAGEETTVAVTSSIQNALVYLRGNRAVPQK